MRTGALLRAALLLAIACVLAVNVPAPSAAAAGGTVTVWVGSWWAPQVPVAMRLWARDHPDITLHIEPLPINGYLDKFSASALGGTPPDVIDLDVSWVSTAASKGLLQPLDGVAGSLDVADYSPGVWQSSRYNGRQYAIPNRASSYVFFYNKTVFDRAHVAYPTDTWTFNDMLGIARKLTIPGQSGIGIGADLSDPSNVMGLLSAVIWAFGGDYLNTDGTKATINSPESVAGLAYWSNLYTKYHVVPAGTPNFTVTRDVIPLFEANKVGMFTSGSDAFNELSKHANVRFGMVLSPQKVNVSGGWTMGVPVGAQNSAGARTFLLWLAKPQNLAAVMNRTPARLSAYKLPPWNSPIYAIFGRSLASARSLPQVGNWAGIQTIIITNAQKILVGQSTPQQAADAMAQQIDDLLAKK